LIGLGWGSQREMREITCIDPETGTFGTLIDLVIVGFAEAVPVEQGMNTSGAGVLDISENMNAVRPFHVEQFGSSASIPVCQFFDLGPLEPESTAAAFAGMYLDTRYLHEL